MPLTALRLYELSISKELRHTTKIRIRLYRSHPSFKRAKLMLQEAPPAPMVGTFEVFRYASGGDIVLMVLGFIGALVQGAGKRMQRGCLAMSIDGWRS